jgi:hypothetical protein
MRRSQFIICCLALSIFICQCTSNKKISNEGLVVQQVHFFDSNINRYVHQEKNFPDTKIWFRDSLLIQEIKALQPSPHDSENSAKIEKAVVLCYSFIDMKTGFTYGFANLSDTSTLLHIHNIDEEKNRPFGAAQIAFWRYVPPAEKLEKKWQVLSDTIILGVLYKRMIWIDKLNPNHSEVLYARCDKKGTYFQFYNLIDKKNGCPFVIYEYMDHLPSGASSGMKSLYEFESAKLDSKMTKIFDVWEKRIDTLPHKNIVYKYLFGKF